MSNISDGFGFSTQVLAVLGFLATIITIVRFFNPATEYILFAELFAQIMEDWREYERLLDESSHSAVFPKLQMLEAEVRDLWFIMETGSLSRICAWRAVFRVKKASTQAKLTRMSLLLLAQMDVKLKNAQLNRSPSSEELFDLQRTALARGRVQSLIQANRPQIPPPVITRIPEPKRSGTGDTLVNGWATTKQELPFRRILINKLFSLGTRCPASKSTSPTCEGISTSSSDSCV